MTGARIMTAELGEADLAWLDAQRRSYFPPERNHLQAHLTMFHALAPSLDDEVVSVIKRVTREPAPAARLSAIMNLGRGTAYRVDSPGLESIRNDFAERFAGMLTAQDNQGWRPHVTIQNKVTPHDARALQAKLGRAFEPRPLKIRGLALHEYCGGPWKRIGSWPFRG